MGIDAGDLWGGVWANAQGASRELIDQLEGLKVQSRTRPAQQGLKVLQQRGDDQLIPIGAGTIQKQAPKLLYLSGL
jgi:hypothetical protein